MDLPVDIVDSDVALQDKYMPYATKKMLFERFVFKANRPVAYYSLTPNGVVRTNECELMKLYRNIKIPGDKGKFTSFFKEWINDPDLRAYASVCDRPPPLSCLPFAYNLWSGFEIETNENADYTRGSIDMFLHHVNIMVNYNRQHANYFIKFLAQIIQQPGYLPGICMVFLSGKEKGKKLFFSLFARLINTDRYCEMFGRKSKVNMDGKLLVCCDGTKNTFAKAGTQKFARVVVTSNHYVDLGKDDWRTSVVRYSDEVSTDPDYFDKFVEYSDNIDNQLAIFKYLQGFDIAGTDWKADRPFV